MASMRVRGRYDVEAEKRNLFRDRVLNILDPMLARMAAMELTHVASSDLGQDIPSMMGLDPVSLQPAPPQEQAPMANPGQRNTQAATAAQNNTPPAVAMQTGGSSPLG